MTQIPEQQIDQHNNVMVQPMNNDMRLLPQVNIPPLIQSQPNMQINGNLPINVQMQMPNNQINNDTSNYFFY